LNYHYCNNRPFFFITKKYEKSPEEGRSFLLSRLNETGGISVDALVEELTKNATKV
jgi:hypothetical protein